MLTAVLRPPAPPPAESPAWNTTSACLLWGVHGPLEGGALQRTQRGPLSLKLLPLPLLPQPGC